MSNVARRREPPARVTYRRRDLESVREILAKALRHHGLDRELARYTFVAHWEEIVGAPLAKLCDPIALKGGCLNIRAHNSAIAQELSFHRHVILNRLKRYVRDEAVTSVFVSVK